MRESAEPNGWPRGTLLSRALGGGDRAHTDGSPSLRSSPVKIPDTLHCANISIISDASCDKDYPGRLMSAMVCAGVPGGGTDSCEVRAQTTLAGERGRARVGE